MSKNQATKAAPAASTAASQKEKGGAAPSNPTATVTTESAKNVVQSGIDITKLTPEQLKALRSQLKEVKKQTTGKKDERFKIIDDMLKEKTEDGKGFKHSTRDILNVLVKEKLVDTTVPDYDSAEIKKIQARKQFLEKKTDEKGNLVYPKNTFGYRPSDHAGFALKPSRITEWLADDDNVKLLSAEQKATIVKKLQASVS